jgi:competence protein ComEA
MFKKFVAALAALLAATAFAAVDANKGTQAELEAIKGIGPSISANIIDERKKSEFKDWTDLVTRVKGVGDRSAANFSAAGLTVNGKGYPGAPVAAAPAKAASGSTNVVAATADKAASGTKSAGHAIAESAREQKAAFKENLAESKAKSAEKKAAKAEAKAEKAAAASAPATKTAAASAPKK